MDPIIETDTLEVCEMYVIRSMRGIGLGTLLLSCSEYIARTEKLRHISLTAKPLDEHWTQKALIEWYKERGYIVSDDDQLSKVLI